MSDDKKNSPLSLFVKKEKSGAAPAAAVSGGKSPKNVQRRWLYIAVGVAGVAVIATSSLSEKKPVRSTAKAADAMISVTPPNADKQAFEAKFGTDMEVLKSSLEQLKADNEKLKQAAANPRATSPMPAGIVAPPSQSNNGGIGPVGVDIPPPPPAVMTRPGGGAPLPVPTYNGMPGTLSPMPVTTNGPPMVFEFKDSSASANPMNANLPAVSAKTTYKKNESAGMLPAGGFAPIALLNGLDAGTSVATQSNPMPVLINVTGQASLPGSAQYRLKSCFALGNGYGDMSAERVYIRVSRLSCVDKNEKLILSQEVAGYVVDSDGKLGLRGKVVDRQGARLGKALLAGFAQGLSGALGNAQGTISSNLDTGSTMSSISGGAAVRAAGLSGAQSAAQQIAEFYLKEAQAIFPVVTIDTGRTGTLVFTNSVSLNWGAGEGQYVTDVKPTGQ